MPDMKIGNLPHRICSDCGEKGCSVFNKGDGQEVPKGQSGSFCSFCWARRQEAVQRGEKPKPLGVQPPGVPPDFLTKDVKVTTQSGSVYHLLVADKDQERLVSHEQRRLYFQWARVICLEIGKPLYLKPRRIENTDLYFTAPVVSVELITR